MSMLICSRLWGWAACWLLAVPAHCAWAQGEAGWARELDSPRVQSCALSLSRRSLVFFLRTGREMKVPDDVLAPLKRRAGVIVTIEKRGQVAPRGCRGTTEPMRESLAREIICNTIAAATRDKRAAPLQAAELSRCRISLTVILQVQPIQNLTEHDVQNCGLMARRGERIGLVLPFEGHVAQVQWRWARLKAGLKASESAQMLEVRAVRFRE